MKLKNLTNLLNNILEFNIKSKPKAKADKQKQYINNLYHDRELTLNACKGRMFPLKLTQEKGLY